MAEKAGSTQPKFKEDFVLLTEFAEIKHGPKPLYVFPPDGNGDFDINSFSVRVFSTDFQHGTDEGFAFPPDSQVLISEPEDRAYAYIHYFALNDIEARGYVRQYCVSYITHIPPTPVQWNTVSPTADQKITRSPDSNKQVSFLPPSNKLVDHFEGLLRHFTEVTRLFKCGNHRVFGEDLDHRVANLEYSIGVVKNTPPEEKLENEDKKEIFNDFYYGSHIEDIPETNEEVLEKDLHYTSHVMELLQEEMVKEDNALVHRMIENERLHDMTNGASKCGNSVFYSHAKPAYQPTRVMAHISQRFTRQLRDLEQLTVTTYSRAMATMRAIQRKYSRSAAVLDMEMDEFDLISPCSSMLSVGHVPMLNLLHKWHRPESLLSSHTYHVNTAQCLQSEQHPTRIRDRDSAEAGSSFDSHSNSIVVVDGEPMSKGCGFDTSFLLINDKTQAYLYLDALPRQRGASIFDPLATPGLPSTSNHFTLHPSLMVSPPRPLSRESSYETPESFTAPNSPSHPGPRIFTKITDTDPTESHPNPSADHRRSSPPPTMSEEELCYQVTQKLGYSAEVPVNCAEEEDERIVSEDSEPSTATIVDSRLMNGTGNGDCSQHENRDQDSPFLRRDRSLAVSFLQNRLSGSDMDSSRHEDTTECSSQCSEFSPVHIEEGDRTAGVGQLEESFASKQSQLTRSKHSSIAGSGSFSSSLKPHFRSQSRGSNHSSGEHSSLANGTAATADVRWAGKPQLLPLQLPTSTRSTPDEKYFTPGIGLTSDLVSPFHLSPQAPPPYTPSRYSEQAYGSEQAMEVSLLSSGGRFPFISSFDLAEVKGEPSLSKPGKELLSLIRDLPEMRDLLYTLLRGKTLVIIGSLRDAPIVKRYIHALWLFVPGHSRSHQVIPVQTTPLQLHQLPHVKLIGICTDKQPALSSEMKRYVSWWDWTTNTLSCPTYTGVLLNPILNRSREKKNDEMFTSLILSTFTDIAMKAYLYYHVYCMKPDDQVLPSLSLTLTRSFSDREVAPRKKHAVSSRNGKTAFLDFIGCKDSDADIVEYFVDVVKKQQLSHWRGLFSVAGPSIENDPPSLTIQHQSCKERICKPKMLKRSSRV